MPGANPGLAARLHALPLQRWERLDMSDLIRIPIHHLDVLGCLPAHPGSPVGNRCEVLQHMEIMAICSWIARVAEVILVMSLLLHQ